MKRKYLLLCTIIAVCLCGCKSSQKESRIPDNKNFPETEAQVEVIDETADGPVETLELQEETGEYTVVDVEETGIYAQEDGEEYDVTVETAGEEGEEYYAETIKVDDGEEVSVEEYSVAEQPEESQSVEVEEIAFDDDYEYVDDFTYNSDYLDEYAEIEIEEITEDSTQTDLDERNEDPTQIAFEDDGENAEETASEDKTLTTGTDQIAETTEVAETTETVGTKESSGTKETPASDGKTKIASAQSFMIDFSDEQYKDYSGYNYGDEEYNECVSKFGPASFPSDKIIAKGRKSAKQLYNFFISKNPNGDVEKAKRLAQLYIEECEIEGVNSDLAFVQMCHETGFLRFGNLVTPDMNNFCGLGSLSKSNPGVRFETERMGVRAHVQHLQAYGSKDKLKQTLIDPRYKYVKPRGKSPTLAGLTGTWAVDPNYDKKIYSFMKELAHF